MKSFFRLVASGFGSGLSPVAPGTTGSAAFLALWLCAANWPFGSQVAWILALCGLGLWVTREALRGGNEHDPGWIVIDEWAGLSVALLPADPSVPLSYLLSFTLFRLFDATKPPPINALEKLPGAFGVMADDIAAGIVAGLLTYGTLLYV